jgi:hypothetical protein
MSSSERATAARMSADPVALEARLSVAALFDVLDRAGAGPLPVRTPGRRPSNYRPAGARRGAVRTVPLRSVRPAPMARPAPGAPRVAETPPPAAPGRLAALIRRAALWGAGAQGEYLAWRPAVQPVRTAARPVVRTPDVAEPRPERRAGLLRRAALWGAGSDGQYLAWGGASRPAARPATDRPVVLRELPSTPTIQLSAPSPAPELSHRRPAPAGPRWTPPVPRGAVAVPGVRPSGPPATSRATGWPPQVTGSGVPTGMVQARGDPQSSPARGSPGPARRARSPNSFRSSFP